MIAFHLLPMAFYVLSRAWSKFEILAIYQMLE